MAKMNPYDRRHRANLTMYQKMIEAIYNSAAAEAAQIAANTRGIDTETPFRFDDYPQTRKRVAELMARLKSRISVTVVNGIDAEWTLANNKNNELANRVFGDNVGRLSQAAYRRYYSTNDNARQAFQARKVSGLNLSERVWMYAEQFKQEIEMGLDVGLRNGLSADEMSRDLRSYLRHPDKLFRRVRDERGQLHLSKAAAAYHPGRGVYRSSYMNARRLAATETNIAYRTSDHTRWQQMDFVVGIEIVLSNNHTCKGPDGKPRPFHDICDELAGRYPKDFKFTGWHPHCRCHAVSILKTQKEIAEDTRKIMNGEAPDTPSVNEVKDVPPAYRDWIANNSDRLSRASSTPYFLSDNPQYAQGVPPRLLTTEAESLPPVNTAPAPYEPVSLDTLRHEYDVTFRRGVPETAYTEGIARNFDFPSIKQQVYQALSDVGINVNRQVARISGEDYFAVHFEGRDKDGKAFVLTRTFTDHGENGIEVHHDLFQLPKSAQGKGTSKRVLGMFYEEYKRMGVTEITVDANIDVGGYTWARYGFNAVSKREAMSAAYGQEAWDFIEDYYNKNGLSEDKPFPMYLLTEQPWGKRALLGSFWEGTLNLNDPTQVARFEKYLGLR